MRPGFLLGYYLSVYDDQGIEFSCYYTYLVSDQCHLPSAGFEAGTVIKLEAGASLTIDGDVSFPDYNPCGYDYNQGDRAVITSLNDDSHGEVIDGSTGSPNCPEYGPALAVQPQFLADAQNHVSDLCGNPGIISSVSTVTLTPDAPQATKGGDPGSFTVTRVDGDWTRDLTVQLSVSGSARAGADYGTLPGSVTIPGSQETAALVVYPSVPSGDAFESTVVVNLQPDSSGTYSLGDESAATVVIIDPTALVPTSPLPAPPGLIAWWRAEGDASDTSGQCNGQVLNGLGFAPGEVGQAFDFEATANRVSVPDAPALNFTVGADFSIEAWVNPVSAYTDYGVQSIVDKRDLLDDWGAVGYEVCLVDGRLAAQIGQAPLEDWNYLSIGPTGPDLRDGQFHHVALVVARNWSQGGAVYVDGGLSMTFDASWMRGDLSNSQPLLIGSHAASWLNCTFKGAIDEVSLYNRALTAAEVQSIFGAGAQGKILGPVQPPQFTPIGGSYAAAQNVAITCATPGATLHYSVTGQEPTQSDPVPTAAIHIAATTTLKAKAWRSGSSPSDTEAETYAIETTPSGQPPTVTVSPPTGTSYLASENVDILVEASDPNAGGGISGIQLFQNGSRVAASVGSPLRYSLSKPSSGTYAFVAKATDNLGFVTVSPAITYNVNASGPVVSLQGEKPLFTSSPGTLVGTVLGVNPDSLASLTLNGNAVPLMTGTLNFSVALAEGANTFTLMATDNQGRSAQASATVTLDSTPPVIAITAPANNSSFSTTRINVSGTFNEASLRRITVNGVPAFVTANTWQALNVGIALGANTITATAQDIAGNSASTSITVTGTGTLVDPVQLQASPVGGFAPLQVSFQVTANVPGTIQQVLYDFDGDGVTDQTATDLSPLNHTYSSPGQYFPVGTVVTSAGRFSSVGGWNGDATRLRINVQTPPVVLATINITDPVDLKWMPGNVLYVLSRSTATITEFDTSGSTPVAIRSVAGIGNSPNGLDVDSAGNVYVAVTGDNQVRRYVPTSSSFQLDTSFNGTGFIGKADKTSGSDPGQLSAPFDVAVSPDGEQLYVADTGNNGIDVFDG